MYRSFFKRIFDVIISVIVLILSTPILIFATVALAVINKGKPFFFQERPGKNTEPFFIIKFKTMTDKKDNQGNLLPDNERITTIGGVIRKLSIDELPQLVNVLKGEMSLIGPRPLLFKYIPLYSPKQLRRHEVKPGITGWAQVNGRNSITWTKKFDLDVEYVDNISFAFDLRIIFLTVKKVLMRDGINQSAARPMQPFNGNN